MPDGPLGSNAFLPESISLQFFFLSEKVLERHDRPKLVDKKSNRLRVAYFNTHIYFNSILVQFTVFLPYYPFHQTTRIPNVKQFYMPAQFNVGKMPQQPSEILFADLQNQKII